jgi:hypothetical protein
MRIIPESPALRDIASSSAKSSISVIPAVSRRGTDSATSVDIAAACLSIRISHADLAHRPAYVHDALFRKHFFIIGEKCVGREDIQFETYCLRLAAAARFKGGPAQI